MSFVEQEDVFLVIENLFLKLFKEFSNKKLANEKFPRIKYSEAIEKYGTDKPDLRNPLIISNITEIFSREDVKFDIFKREVSKGKVVKAIITKNTKDKPRSFFDNIDNWAKKEGSGGLAYFTFTEENNKIVGKGPIGKFFSSEACEEILKLTNSKIGDSIFMSCGQKKDVEKILSLARNKIAEDLKLISNDIFSVCWIIDYPMYELYEKTKKIKFSHNPFSMPQGEIKDIYFSKPLEIKA